VDGVETERLLLRRWRPDDIDALADIFALPDVWQYPFGRGLTQAESAGFLDRQMDHWETHGFGMWAAELKADRTLIGYIGLAVPTWLPQVLPAVEVGWRLHPAHWGKGLATEGGAASLTYGFETLGLDRILAMVMPGNVASIRVTTKLGMHDWLTTTDEVRNVELQVFEITVAEWRPSQGAPRGSWPRDPLGEPGPGR